MSKPESNEAPPVHYVHAERSYDQRAHAIIAFNQSEGDLDDKLEAAWLAMLKAAKLDPGAAHDRLEAEVAELKAKASLYETEANVATKAIDDHNADCTSQCAGRKIVGNTSCYMVGRMGSCHDCPLDFMIEPSAPFAAMSQEKQG